MIYACFKLLSEDMCPQRACGGTLAIALQDIAHLERPRRQLFERTMLASIAFARRKAPLPRCRSHLFSPATRRF